MNYLIASYKNSDEKEKIENKGLFCYDLRTTDDGDKISTIEKKVVVNRVGTIITDEKLEFDTSPNNYIEFDKFVLENQGLDSIDELLNEKMKKKVVKIINDVSRYLTTLEKEDDGKIYNIDYILYNSKDDSFFVLANDGGFPMKAFNLKDEYDLEEEMFDISEWMYSADEYIFEYLEQGYEIKYMTAETHYGLWCEIENKRFEDNIDELDGVQKYLKYCYENEITKEYLDNKVDLDVIDIMKLYKGEYLKVEDNQVQMSKAKYVKLNETAYIAFVLGYDLLNDMLSKSSTPENDICYDFCNMIAGEFLQSEEYKNEKYSTYDMLEKWLDERMEEIENRFQEYSLNKENSTMKEREKSEERER